MQLSQSRRTERYARIFLHAFNAEERFKEYVCASNQLLLWQLERLEMPRAKRIDEPRAHIVLDVYKWRTVNCMSDIVPD